MASSVLAYVHLAALTSSLGLYTVFLDYLFGMPAHLRQVDQVIATDYYLC